MRDGVCLTDADFRADCDGHASRQVGRIDKVMRIGAARTSATR